MYEVTGRGHLASGLPARQIAARVSRRRIKLQGLQGQVFEVRHGVDGIFYGNNSVQYRGLNVQVGAAFLMTSAT